MQKCADFTVFYVVSIRVCSEQDDTKSISRRTKAEHNRLLDKTNAPYSDPIGLQWICVALNDRAHNWWSNLLFPCYRLSLRIIHVSADKKNQNDKQELLLRAYITVPTVWCPLTKLFAKLCSFTWNTLLLTVVSGIWMVTNTWLALCFLNQDKDELPSLMPNH